MESLKIEAHWKDAAAGHVLKAFLCSINLRGKIFDHWIFGQDFQPSTAENAPGIAKWWTKVGLAEGQWQVELG